MERGHQPAVGTCSLPNVAARWPTRARPLRGKAVLEAFGDFNLSPSVSHRGNVADGQVWIKPASDGDAQGAPDPAGALKNVLLSGHDGGWKSTTTRGNLGSIFWRFLLGSLLELSVVNGGVLGVFSPIAGALRAAVSVTRGPYL
jgi:hypothetical protein